MVDHTTRKIPYADLEWEADQLVSRAADRLQEKHDRRGTAYRGDDPGFHAELAEDHFTDLQDAVVNANDLDAARKEAADILNHLLMALSNVPDGGPDADHEIRADGSGAAIGGDLLDKLEDELRQHSGPDEAITSSELSELLDTADSEGNPKTREAIRVLMEERRIPIAADNNGYYLIETSEQLEKYLDTLEARKNGIEQRRQLVTTAWLRSGASPVRTDGGSKYVNETGDGYQGRYRISNYEVKFNTSGMSVDWTIDATIYALDDDQGVRLRADSQNAEVLQERTVISYEGSPGVVLSGDSLRPLGLGNGDEIRVYDDEKPGLLVVPAEDDPRVMTDGSGTVPEDGEYYLDGFVSGDHHILRDGHEPDRPAPEDACIECGRDATQRCQCCGRKLCGMCSELGGGFCSNWGSANGIPLCVHGESVSLYKPLLREDQIYVVVEPDDSEFHVPHTTADDCMSPGCAPEATLERARLVDVFDDAELCEDCEAEIVADFEGGEE